MYSQTRAQLDARQLDGAKPLPMVSEAREVLDNIFSHDSLPLWAICFPSAQTTEQKPPSSQTFEVIPLLDMAEQPNSARDSERARLLELCTPIIQKLEKEGDKLTRGPLTHNASFWTIFFRSLVVEISGGLLARPGHQRNEAEVRHKLLTPLLRRIAHSLSTIEAPEGVAEGSMYWSALNYE